MRSWLVPMPAKGAPSVAPRKRHSPWTWGSLAAFRITVVPSASAAAITAFSVAVTLASSRKTFRAAEPALEGQAQRGAGIGRGRRAC